MYRPTVSDEYAEQIRRWHENAYAQARAEAGDGQTFDYLGLTLVVPPDVHPINAMSHLLGQAVLDEVRPGDRVLDMGTGCGVNAILAASQSTDVLAVDVNPHAVTAARENAERNGVADRVEVRESDVFEAVDGDFDLVVFDPPFRWFAPRDLLERGSADESYRALTTFFRTVRAYLRPGARMLIFFGTSGDLGYLERLVAEAGFHSDVIAQRRLEKDNWQVDYYTYRLTTPAAPRPPLVVDQGRTAVL